MNKLLWEEKVLRLFTKHPRPVRRKLKELELRISKSEKSKSKWLRGMIADLTGVKPVKTIKNSNHSSLPCSASG